LANTAERRHPHEGYIPAAHVGTLLQETRLRLGQDLRIVADDLRIRYHHLLAIEDGRFDDLPGATYVTGFIRAYAEYLGLDAEEIIRRYKNEPQGAKPADHLDFPAPANSGRLPAGALLLVLLAVASLAYGGWYWMSTNNTSMAELIPAIPDRLASLMEGDDGAGPATGQAEQETSPEPAERADPTETTEPTAETPDAAPVDTATDTVDAADGGAEDGGAADEGAPAGDGLAALNPTSPTTPPAQDPAATAAEETAPADDDAPAPDDVTTPTEPATPDVAAVDETEEAEETAPPAEEAATAPGPEDAEDPQPAEAPDAVAPDEAAPDEGVADEGVADEDVAPTEPVTDGADEAGDGDAAEPAEAPETPEAAAPAIPETETAETAEAPEPPAEPETEEPAEPEEEPTPAYIGRAAPSEVQSVANGSRIVLRANRDSWIQVRKGGDLVVRRLLRRGDTYAVPTDGGYTLNTSNAGGLEVYVDGRRVRNLGPVGVPRNGVRLSPGSLN